MSTFTQLLYQIVFGSKDYTSFLTETNDNLLFAYIAGILKQQSCHSYIVGGACNHIHIVTNIHPGKSPSSVIKDIKIASHKMILENSCLYANFTGCQVDMACLLIIYQQKRISSGMFRIRGEHHMKKTFKDEYTGMLKYHSVDYNEKYLLI